MKDVVAANERKKSQVTRQQPARPQEAPGLRPLKSEEITQASEGSQSRQKGKQQYKACICHIQKTPRPAWSPIVQASHFQRCGTVEREEDRALTTWRSCGQDLWGPGKSR